MIIRAHTPLLGGGNLLVVKTGFTGETGAVDFKTCGVGVVLVVAFGRDGDVGLFFSELEGNGVIPVDGGMSYFCICNK